MKAAKFLLIVLFLAILGYGEEKTSTDGSTQKGKSELGKAEDVGGYLVQPPKKYTRINPPGKYKVTAWVGQERYDKTRPMVMFLVLTLPEDEMPTLDEFMREMLDGVKRRRSDWLESKPRKVNINGLDFIRVSWTGIDIVSKKRMHGIMYTAIDKKKLIQIHTQDRDPYHNSSLKLGEKAILTFRKKPE